MQFASLGVHERVEHVGLDEDAAGFARVGDVLVVFQLEERWHVLDHLVEFEVHGYKLGVRAGAAETRCGHQAVVDDAARYLGQPQSL